MKIGVSLPAASTFGVADREWLWRDWVPAGALTVLAGDPGTGKSTVAAAIAAAVSCGGVLPSGEQAKRGRVVIFNSEDQIAQTINPRLIAAGADMSMVHYAHETMTGFGTRAFDPSSDLPYLQQTIAHVSKGDNPVRLVIIDPLMAAIRGVSATPVRESLENCARLAESTGCAILGIGHFSKGSSKKPPAERVSGSLSTVAVARSVLATISAKETDEMPVLMRVKSNVSSCDGYYPYVVEPATIEHGVSHIQTTKVVWNEFQAGESRTVDDAAEGSAIEDASEFLRAVIPADGKPMREIEAETQFQSFSFRTVRRAQALLGIHARRVGKEWVWFPASPPSM